MGSHPANLGSITHMRLFNCHPSSWTLVSQLPSPYIPLTPFHQKRRWWRTMSRRNIHFMRGNWCRDSIARCHSVLQIAFLQLPINSHSLLYLHTTVSGTAHWLKLVPLLQTVPVSTQTSHWTGHWTKNVRRFIYVFVWSEMDRKWIPHSCHRRASGVLRGRTATSRSSSDPC